MVTAAPALDTPRLTLRAHAAADFDDSFAMWSDPDIVRYVGGIVSTRGRAWSRLLNFAGLWTLLGYGYWAVREKASGRYVGEVGFADFHRDLEPSFDGIPEMGWVLDAWCHGKGYASEAGRAALAWADAQWPGARTVCMIDPENTPSRAVARKLGFTEFARAPYTGDEVILLERFAPPRD